MIDENKTFLPDLYNINNSILEKRDIMIALYSQYRAYYDQFKLVNKTTKKNIIECLYYLIDYLCPIGIKDGWIDKIQEPIDYEEVKRIINDHFMNSKEWNNREIKQVYDFLIEASMMSGLVDPGKININKNIVKSRTTKKIIEKGTKTKEEDENKYII